MPRSVMMHGPLSRLRTGRVSAMGEDGVADAYTMANREVFSAALQQTAP